MPTYYEVMTTGFGRLLAAADKWKEMADEFYKVEKRYRDSVQKITMDRTWLGESASVAQTNFAATRYEYQAAQTQAKAIASLLRAAHEQFTDLKKKVESARDDAIAAGMTVSEQGRVAFDFSQLTPAERSAHHHDPDGQATLRASVATWQQHIDDRVRAISEADQTVKTALTAAVVDSNKDAFGKGDDATFNGFNAHADGDLAHAGGSKADEAKTKTDGWTSEGKASAKGPSAEFKVTGPKYGKEGSVKAAADLFHVNAEGAMTRGDWKLSGVADAYGGARATANFGFTDTGLNAKAEGSMGLRGLAEGRAEYGPYAAAYGRVEGFAGAEASAGLKAGKDAVVVNAKAFAGGKASVAGGGELAGIGFGTTAEGWAGPGAEAKYGLEKNEDGVYKLGGKVGLSPALGGSVGLEFTVDPDKVSQSVSDAADALGNVVGDGVDTIGDTADSVTDTVGGWLS
ncbi:hypothetical protein [Streptomyces sp. NPDC057382]|uniref:hypothetical protein n=1 Tax=unclassified Streptomyces TaxID=2593676 RepID=UPI003626BD0E